MKPWGLRWYKFYRPGPCPARKASAYPQPQPRIGEYVYKIINDVAKLTPIVTDGTFGANVLISEGVSEGDQIVVVGMKNLGIDTKVEVEVLH